MILMELIVLTSQSFIIKKGWFCKKEDDGGGVLYTAMGSIHSWQATRGRVEVNGGTNVARLKLGD
jgi:hypothetical protein